VVVSHFWLKFQPMGKLGIDDESEYGPAIDDEPPDNDLDADFDDGSDDNKKPASKPSSKSASKVTVKNQEAPMGSALKRPPGCSKTKAAKAAATAAMKPKKSCQSILLCPVIMQNWWHPVKRLQPPFATKANGDANERG
jgi:hypothetical protein